MWEACWVLFAGFVLYNFKKKNLEKGHVWWNVCNSRISFPFFWNPSASFFGKLVSRISVALKGHFFNVQPYASGSWLAFELVWDSLWRIFCWKHMIFFTNAARWIMKQILVIISYHGVFNALNNIFLIGTKSAELSWFGWIYKSRSSNVYPVLTITV